MTVQTLVLYSGNGTSRLFSIPFDYLDEADVKVSIYNYTSNQYEEKAQGDPTYGWSFTNASTVEFDTAPPAPTDGSTPNIRIERLTDIESPDAVFTPGSPVKAADLNDNFDQSIYAVQEIRTTSVRVDGSTPMVGDLNLGGFDVYNGGARFNKIVDMGDNRITDVGDPSSSSDAATKGYVDGPRTTDLNLNGFDVYNGGARFNQPVDLANNRITGVGTPASGADAATKDYVDTAIPPVVPGFDGVAVDRFSYTSIGGETALASGDSGVPVFEFVPGNESIYLNGSRLTRNVDYTCDTTTLVTFTQPLLVGDVVDALCYNYLPSQVDSDSVNTASIVDGAVTEPKLADWTQDGTGAVGRNIHDKLKDVVSVKDFGAVGDGVADDTDALSNAKFEAVSAGKPLLVPQGSYKSSGTVYTSNGPFLYLEDDFNTPVNLPGSLENNTILLTGATPDTTPLDPRDSRVLLSSTVIANGANHADAARLNLINKSTDGNGNTAVYTRATNYSNAQWGAALHGETRHNGGTNIGCNIEATSYTTSGSLIGVNVQNTSGGGDNHPETGGASAQSPATKNWGVNIQGRSGVGDLGLWYYGIYLQDESIKSTGTAIKIDSSCSIGIDLLQGTFTTVALRIGNQQRISFDGTNSIQLGYNLSAAGGPALEVYNGADVNLRLYNNGISEFRGAVRPNVDNGINVGAITRRWASVYAVEVHLGNGQPFITAGNVNPEGQITAPVGSIYTRTNGGVGSTLYVKELGTGNTGWVAK